MTTRILRLEGLAMLGLSIYLYFLHFSYSGWLFLLLLFVPDLSMIGYLMNNKIGAILYNLIHTYTFPIILLLCGFLFSYDPLVMISLIVFSHIGLDRMCGFGLKHSTDFKDTHLNYEAER